MYVKEIANMGEIIKAESSISLYLLKHKGSTVDYKAQQREPRSTTFKQKYQLRPNELSISSGNRKMTERWRAVDDRLRLMGELKIRKDVKMERYKFSDITAKAKKGRCALTRS